LTIEELDNNNTLIFDAIFSIQYAYNTLYALTQVLTLDIN